MYTTDLQYSFLNEKLKEKLYNAFDNLDRKIFTGSTWTTDDPYRETAEAIEYYKSIGIQAVEMEAASLYAFAEARNKNVICFAHVTNQMASVDGDFEKGEHNGSIDTQKVLFAVMNRLKNDL